MSAYLASSMARDHVNTLLATAAASRRAKEARLAARAHRAQTKRSGAVGARHQPAGCATC